MALNRPDLRKVEKILLKVAEKRKRPNTVILYQVSEKNRHRLTKLRIGHLDLVKEDKK